MENYKLLLVVVLASFVLGDNSNTKSYANCAVLSDQVDLRLYWTVNSRQSTIDVKIQSTSVNGYTAVGLSADGTMSSSGEGSDAWVVGFNNNAGDKCAVTETSGGCIGDLKITGYTSPSWDSKQSLTNVVVGHNTTHVWGQFTRALDTGDSDDRVISVDGDNYVIYASNPSYTLTYGKLTSHRTSGSQVINFGESSSCPGEDSSSTTGEDSYTTGDSTGTTEATTGETTGDDDGETTSRTTIAASSTSGNSAAASSTGSNTMMVYLVSMKITSTIEVTESIFSTALSLAKQVASDRIVILTLTKVNTTARAHYQYSTDFYYKDQPNGPSAKDLATETKSLANTTLSPEITINDVSVKYTSVPNNDTTSEAVVLTISALFVALVSMLSI